MNLIIIKVLGLIGLVAMMLALFLLYQKIQAVLNIVMVSLKEITLNRIMGKRVTIVLDEDLLKKLHEIQKKLIKESTVSVSFSSVVNVTLRKGIK